MTCHADTHLIAGRILHGLGTAGLSGAVAITTTPGRVAVGVLDGADASDVAYIVRSLLDVRLNDASASGWIDGVRVDCSAVVVIVPQAVGA